MDRGRTLWVGDGTAVAHPPAFTFAGSIACGRLPVLVNALVSTEGCHSQVLVLLVQRRRSEEVPRLQQRNQNLRLTSRTRSSAISEKVSVVQS